MTYTINILRNNNLIIFEALAGSHAYGTSLPTSDKDFRGVYIQPMEDILGMNYVDQVSDKKNDIVFYEIKRFLEMVQTNNPNIIELLNVPEDCIVSKDPIFDLVLEHKDIFLTKKCRYTFSGYAIDQIKKARGLNKKMNWDEASMKRKTVLDFCYVLKDGGSILFEDWVKKSVPRATFRNFALANIDHAHDLYAMYKRTGLDMVEYPNGGIVSDEEKANEVQLTSIPKGHSVFAYLTFNKDAYSTHCKRYSEYKTWLKERNEDRFKMNKEHGKNYDSKNMLHTFRLLNMGIEIANEGRINVRRSPEEIEILMKIRRGEYEYDNLIQEAEAKLESLDKLYEKCNLPEKIDKNFIDNLLITIRKLNYKL